jgi:starch phosphorylase
VPVYFLDTNLLENSQQDRGLTDYLYGGDNHHRLLQEVLLGMGGVAMLRAMSYQGVQIYHMNEGHCAFATLALLRERINGSGPTGLTRADVEAVRRMCVFTTHTPVPAGHDEFPIDMVRYALGEENCTLLAKTEGCPNGTLNMSHLALAMSRYVNGVSKRHSEVSRGMFPGEPIAAITNGVHAVTWASQSFSALFDKHMPGWQHDNNYLRNANEIPLGEIRKAHAESKAQLIDKVEKMSGIRLDADVFTIGFARRAVAYKRADLLFSDLGRLRRIANKVGPIQVIFAGKAHPRDEWGKSIIRKVFEAAEALKGTIPVVYLEDYNMALGKLLTSGVDLWLNNPQRPMEASGTSGMKAALNGVPTLSVLDGWWVEGHVENITGWSIDGTGDAEESASMYKKLEKSILPMFYRDPAAYAQIMRSAIVLNGSYFNSHRMLLQYMGNAYNNTAAPALV